MALYDKYWRQFGGAPNVSIPAKTAARSEDLADVADERTRAMERMQTEYLKASLPTQETRQYAKAMRAGEELGSPESWGGQGPFSQEELDKMAAKATSGEFVAPQPVPIIRRMTTTHTGPNVGGEYLSPGQARQAYRREMGIGEYVPPQQPRDPLKALQAQEHTWQVIRQQLEQMYGEEVDAKDAKGNKIKIKVLSPDIEQHALSLLSKGMPKSLREVPAFVEKVGNEVGFIREKRPYEAQNIRGQAFQNYIAIKKDDPRATREFDALMEQQGLSPEQFFRTAPITRQNLQAFQSFAAWTKPPKERSWGPEGLDRPLPEEMHGPVYRWLGRRGVEMKPGMEYFEQIPGFKAEEDWENPFSAPYLRRKWQENIAPSMQTGETEPIPGFTAPFPRRFGETALAEDLRKMRNINWGKLFNRNTID